MLVAEDTALCPTSCFSWRLSVYLFLCMLVAGDTALRLNGCNLNPQLWSYSTVALFSSHRRRVSVECYDNFTNASIVLPDPYSHIHIHHFSLCTHTHTYPHTRTHTHTHTHAIHAHTHAHTHAPTHMHVHTHTHACTHMHARTHMPARTHTHHNYSGPSTYTHQSPFVVTWWEVL